MAGLTTCLTFAVGVLSTKGKVGPPGIAVGGIIMVDISKFSGTGAGGAVTATGAGVTGTALGEGTGGGKTKVGVLDTAGGAPFEVAACGDAGNVNENAGTLEAAAGGVHETGALNDPEV